MAYASMINSSSFALAHVFISSISFGHSGALQAEQRGPAADRGAVKFLSAGRSAMLHCVKVPHFTLTSRTNFPYISYKFTHFRFFKIAAVHQLQLRFTYVNYSNLAAMRRSALCSNKNS